MTWHHLLGNGSRHLGAPANSTKRDTPGVQATPAPPDGRAAQEPLAGCCRAARGAGRGRRSRGAAAAHGMIDRLRRQPGVSIPEEYDVVLTKALLRDGSTSTGRGPQCGAARTRQLGICLRAVRGRPQEQREQEDVPGVRWAILGVRRRLSGAFLKPRALGCWPRRRPEWVARKSGLPSWVSESWMTERGMCFPCRFLNAKASRAARRASRVSATTFLSLRRDASHRHFHDPASLRARTSAHRNSSARASAASARSRSRSYSDRQSGGSAASEPDTGQSSSGPPASATPACPFVSRIAMPSTILHSGSRYQVPPQNNPHDRRLGRVTEWGSAFARYEAALKNSENRKTFREYVGRFWFDPRNPVAPDRQFADHRAAAESQNGTARSPSGREGYGISRWRCDRHPGQLSC